MSALMAKAYYMPTTIEGGFPRACLCLFIFSLGSAPMFFLLLMVRDIVGVRDPPVLQMHFSIISIVFFVCAAIASSVGAVSSFFERDHDLDTPDDGSDSGGTGGPSSSQASNSMRWPLMVLSTAIFGFVCAVIPGAGLWSDFTMRLVTFYIIAGFLGLSFGSVYARFQDCTWSLLPGDADIANLMGFAAMSKLAGVGIGNFVAGLILDSYVRGGSIEFSGYILMCAFCATVVGVAAVLAWSVGRMAMPA